MRLDHVSYACGPEGLSGTVDRLSEAIGVAIPSGGVHPRFGTTNAILGLANGIYLEVVGVLEHPAAERAAFGQAVRRRTDGGGGWMAWVVAVDNLRSVETRLHRPAVDGHRTRPDGHELRWRQIGVNDMIADPQLPFFVEWQSPREDHPSSGADGAVRLTGIEVSGSPHELAAWLGDPAADPFDGVHLSWTDGPRGIRAAHLDTPNGPVRLT